MPVTSSDSAEATICTESFPLKYKNTESVTVSPETVKTGLLSFEISSSSNSPVSDVFFKSI